ncbi:PrgI family protein [Micromonospora kangleipakensis]|uniref:PrgI family protein n=1 Tax=Micromonospora kangleipakensis TaxID=1077942 RepID=A0A4Q8BDQ9_9ACTN|nr:PrgI family protein [Micromonospora kangleipakensis]RZU76037.1 PrgI family protein [Micromonospora kangleipakensis]
MEQPYTTRVPADIDTPDRIAWGLSFRQLAILAGVGATSWAVYSQFGPALPLPVWLALAVPVAAVTAVVALGRRDGLPLDVWLRHGLTLRRTPRLQAPGQPGGVPVLDAPAPVPAPLRAAAVAIAADGTVHVDGTARTLVACGTTNIALRTVDEQRGLLDGFGRWLNALTAPAQIVVAAHRHLLAPYADAVHTDALPHPALRDAATDYAAFLRDLDAEREPLRRQVTVTVAGAHEPAVRALAAVGVTAQVLDGPAVTAALAAAADPYDPPVPGPRAVPGTPIIRSNR